LQINIDGIPLYKSNRKQLWPILCKVHYDPDIYKLFVVGTTVRIVNPITLTNIYINLLMKSIPYNAMVYLSQIV